MDTIFIILILIGAAFLLYFIFKKDNSPSTYPMVPAAANTAFTKLFDVGMRNTLVLTQQNTEVERELRNNRQTIFSKTQSSSAQYINFASSRSEDDFQRECQKFIMLATAWGVYYGYKLNQVFSGSSDKIVSIIYNEINVSMSGTEQNTLHFFATRSGAQKLIRSRLDGILLGDDEDDDDVNFHYHDMSDFEDENSDFDNKVYGLRKWLIAQDYGHANSDLLSVLISSANLYWSQLPSGMSTSRYASFECAVWSVFLCRFMLFSQLQKTHEFIDEFTKDIIEMLVAATSREYGFDKTQVDDFVWERFAVYDKITMSKRENSQKTDAMLGYLVDLILYETSKKKLVKNLALSYVPNVTTRLEAYHLATAFYEAVVTSGGEILRDRYAHAFYSFIY